MSILYLILWFGVGFFGIYKWLMYEEIGSSMQRHYYDCRGYPKKPFIDRDAYIFFIFFFIGPISLILWLVGYLYNRKEIIEHKKILKENTPKLTLKQIRLKKLKRINRFNRFKIWAY